MNNAVQRFVRWLEASSGEPSYTYYTGFLMVDRETHYTISGQTAIVGYNEPQHTLGLLAWAAQESGLVYLVQKRLAPSVYEYRALKRKRSAWI